MCLFVVSRSSSHGVQLQHVMVQPELPLRFRSLRERAAVVACPVAVAVVLAAAFVVTSVLALVVMVVVAGKAKARVLADVAVAAELAAMGQSATVVKMAAGCLVQDREWWKDLVSTNDQRQQPRRKPEKYWATQTASQRTVRQSNKRQTVSSRAHHPMWTMQAEEMTEVITLAMVMARRAQGMVALRQLTSKLP